MSKLFPTTTNTNTNNSSSSKLFTRSYRTNNQNLNQSVQDIIDLYSQNNNSYLNNRNNITVDYPRHYSPPSYRSPGALPLVTTRKNNLSQERGLQRLNVKPQPLYKNQNESTILTRLGSNIINNSSLNLQRLKRDKTEIMLVGAQNNNNGSLLPHINNITNINIHIYPNHPQQNAQPSLYVNNKKRRMLRGNIKITSNPRLGGPNTLPAELLFEGKNNNNNNDISANSSNSSSNNNSNYLYDNISAQLHSDNSNNNVCDGNSSTNTNNIDTQVKFLRDISTNTTQFEMFMQLIQSHIDIEMCVDNIFGGNAPFRRRNTTTISNDMLFKLSKLLNYYFNILHAIYFTQEHSVILNTDINDAFFIFPWINQTFHRIIKVQMCIYASVMVTMSQLGVYEISTMLKNHFQKIIKEISSPLYSLFDTFALEELSITYNDVLQRAVRGDFLGRFKNLYTSERKVNKAYKNSELLSLINKNVDKCINSLKYYSTLNLKYSLIKPYGDALTQLLNSLDRKTLKLFAKLILTTLLYGELDKNKNALAFISNAPLTNNNVNTVAPFLPPISKEYKYTLVLDMDETLIHFFFTHLNGMFFVRPFCFEFLHELNSLYEIVTFTAGTKDYADGILNQLDKNGNIIKYRLYRQHTSITGCNVYKDLSKIGRDLSKTIIIDNLRENFKLQPNNGLFIKTWTSDVNDIQFRDLKKILKDIVILNVNDVREIIQKINEDIKRMKNPLNPYIGIDVTKYV